jgi:predicted nucleotidyltransferase
MDLVHVLREIRDRFHNAAVRYALMGGYAVAIHGYPRATVDLDFLVDRFDLSKVDEILQDMGYRLEYRSEDVSQFLSPNDRFGEVDFVHAFRDASMRMLKQANAVALFPDGPPVKVLRVEDVIGMKVQAIANAPHRRAQDQADIQNLVWVHHQSIDWELLEEYFSLFDMTELLNELKARPWRD